MVPSRNGVKARMTRMPLNQPKMNDFHNFLATYICVWVCTAIFIGPNPVQGQTKDTWIDHMTSCLDKVHSVKASFTHETIHRLKAKSSIAKGTVILGRGGKIRMTYLTPEKKIVVSDGKTIRALDANAKTVVETPARRDPLYRAFNMIIEPVKKLHNIFSIRLIQPALIQPAREGAKPKKTVISLIPRKPIGYASQILLTLSPTCPPLERVVFIDKVGTATRITLKNIETNVKIGTSLFKLKIPRGAKIVRP